MPDPLAEYADRTVPEPTNFFDPEEARTIISRYANTRRERDATQELAKSSMMFNRQQYERDRMAREQLMQSREDVEYAAKNDALRQRGDFLRQMGQQLDPRSPDYNRQVTEFLSGLPEELVNDPSIRGVLASMNSEADDTRGEQRMETSNKLMLDRQQQMFREKAQYGNNFTFLTQEDWDNNVLPDGSQDLRTLNAIGAERARADKENAYKNRVNAMAEGRIRVIEAADLSKKGRANRTKVERYLLEDRAAFPRRLDALAERYKEVEKVKSVNVDSLKDSPKWREEYAKAKAWDAKTFDNELNAAFTYDDPDKYVNLVDGLTDAQKERRLRVWEHAHKDGGVEEIEEDADPETPTSTEEVRKVIGGVSYIMRDGKVYKE